MAKKKKIEICSVCNQEKCTCNIANKLSEESLLVREESMIVNEKFSQLEESVIKTDKQIKVEYYLNHFLKPGWESQRIINSSMIDTLGFKDRKFNNTFRKEYTNLTGLTSAGCECLKTYIRLLQKLLNMYNEK